MSTLPIRHLLAQALMGDHEGVESVLLSDIYSSGGSRNLSMDKAARVVQILGYTKTNAAAVTSNTGAAAMMLRGLHHYTKQSGGTTTRQEIGIFDDQAAHYEFRVSTDIGATWTFKNDLGIGSINTQPDFSQSGNLLFMANGVLAPQQWDGTTLTTAGGTQLGAPTYTKTGAGNLSGNVAFRILPTIGATRKLSSVQSINYALNAETGHVDWVADADVTVTGYEVYRTSGSGSVFYLDGSVVGRTTVTFTTNQTDTNLQTGRVLQEFGDPPPVGCYFVEIHKQRMWFGRTNLNPRQWVYSDSGLPFSVDNVNTIVDCTDAESWSDFSTGGTGGFLNMMVLWLERSVWTVSGTLVVTGGITDITKRRTDAQMGTVSHRTVARIPAGAKYTDESGNTQRTSSVMLAYFSPLHDVRLFDGNNDTIISFPKKTTLSTANYAQRGKTYCIHDRDRQEVSWVYADGASAEPNVAVVWNYRYGVWFERDWGFACGLEIETPGSASVLIAGEAFTANGGFAYQLWNGFNFNGGAINSQWMTRTLYGQGFFSDPTGYYGKPLLGLRKRWRWADLLLNVAGGGITFTLEWIVGDNPADGAEPLASKSFMLPGTSLVDAQGNLIADAGGNVLRASTDASLIRTQLKDSTGQFAHSRGLRLRLRATTITGQWSMAALDTAYQLLPGETRDIGTIP